MTQDEIDSSGIIRNELGEVAIDGCLIFHSKPTLITIRHSDLDLPWMYVTNNTIYNVLPRWWNIFGWYRLIRYLQKYCPHRDNARQFWVDPIKSRNAEK